MFKTKNDLPISHLKGAVSMKSLLPRRFRADIGKRAPPEPGFAGNARKTTKNRSLSIRARCEFREY